MAAACIQADISSGSAICIIACIIFGLVMMLMKFIACDGSGAPCQIPDQLGLENDCIHCIGELNDGVSAAIAGTPPRAATTTASRASRFSRAMCLDGCGRIAAASVA